MARVAGIVSGKRRGSMVSPRFTWRTALLLTTVVGASPTRALSDEADVAVQAASASPVAHENRHDENQHDENRPPEHLAPEQLMRQAGVVLQQWWHEATVGGDVGGRDRSRMESPDQARRRVLRTLWRPYTLEVERDLKSILDQVSEETGLEYRFDPEALRQTGVDPAQALVAIASTNQPLVTVLREILKLYGLQPGLEGAVVVIVVLPSLPPELQRPRPAGNIPIPDVSGGTVLVRDEPEEVTPTGATAAVDALPELAENEALKSLRLELTQRTLKRNRLLYQRELQACLTLANATSEQEQQLRALVEQVENDLAARWVDTYIRVCHQGWAAKLQEFYPEVRKPLESAILRELKQLGLSEWAVRYERQTVVRAAHRQRATIRGIVMMVDRRLALTSAQRNALEQLLRRQWQPEWERVPNYLSYGLFLVPRIPAIEDLLNVEQQSIWRRLKPKGFIAPIDQFPWFVDAPREDEAAEHSMDSSVEPNLSDGQTGRE